MSEKYPEQSKYVKGNKIWLELDNEQELIISPQAREVLEFYGIDEKKFVEKLKELLKECFPDFHRLSVSKAKSPILEDDEGETPHIKIEIYDQWKKRVRK